MPLSVLLKAPPNKAEVSVTSLPGDLLVEGICHCPPQPLQFTDALLQPLILLVSLLKTLLPLMNLKSEFTNKIPARLSKMRRSPGL